MVNVFLSVKETKKAAKLTNKASKATERQGVILPLQLLLSPYLAAGIPAVGAAAIGVYGSYGNEIRTLYNSIFGEL